MDARKIQAGIRKTGFHLEHQVASTLRQGGWTVISNRYYVDDQEDAVREMDLVAYRVRELAEFRLYTTLIISCKKSDKNVWALLARTRDRDDPNIDWWPVHVWSNDRALAFAIGRPGWTKHYYSRAQELGVSRVALDPEVEIFAYQEMNRESGAPQNDKPIFASVTSLMKAQSYEIDALPERKKIPSVYQFNLLTVVDADLVRAHLDNPDVEIQAVSDELYVARYIIKKKETSARIHFVNAKDFPRLLEDYGRLHAANATLFREGKDSFYRGILLDRERRSVFEEAFSEAVLWKLNWRLRQAHPGHTALKSLSVSLSREGEVADVELETDDSVINFLNGDSEAKDDVSKALKEVYRYEGAFRFVDNSIPF
jgi:hypothetical protein